MNRRDVATIAFRLLATWVFVSGVTDLLTMLFTWQSVAAQMGASMPNVASPLSGDRMVVMAALAFGARAALGVLLWFISPVLAWLAVPPAENIALADRSALVTAASLLVGTWLLGQAIPSLAYTVLYAVRTGWRPADAESAAQLAELLTKGLLGISFVRGTWMLRLLPRTEPPAAGPTE